MKNTHEISAQSGMDGWSPTGLRLAQIRQCAREKRGKRQRLQSPEQDQINRRNYVHEALRVPAVCTGG